MTAAADTIRDQRRLIAAPGGPHDRLVARLGHWLPVGVGALLGVMVFGPLAPRSEVSFLLDRNRVAITPERLTVSNANYRGEDGEGRAFSVRAGSAVQHSASVPLVLMKDLVAHLQLDDGPGEVAAAAGSYDIRQERITVAGPATFQAGNGYRMVTTGLSVDLKARTAAGTGGVAGSIPAGTFSADRVSADLARRTVMLSGHARLRMVPGKVKMRMPQ